MLSVKSVRLPSVTSKKLTFNNRLFVTVSLQRLQRVQINFFQNSVPSLIITKKATILKDSVQTNWRFYRNSSSNQEKKKSDTQGATDNHTYKVNIRNDEKPSAYDNFIFGLLLFVIAKGSYDFVMSLYNINANYQSDSDITVPVWNGVEADSSWKKKQSELIGEDVSKGSKLITKKEGLSLRILPFIVEAMFPEEAIPNLPWYSRFKLFDIYSTFWIALPVSGSKANGRIVAKAQTHNGEWHVKRIEVLTDPQ